MQKPEHPHIGASCVVFGISCITARCTRTGVLYEMAGDGNCTGGSKNEIQGCRNPNTRVLVLHAWVFSVSCITARCMGAGGDGNCAGVL